MQIRFTFSGLCLFVPQTGTRDTVSVLLPPTGGPIHSHRAVLLFDTGTLRQTPEATSQYTHLDLAGRNLSFGNQADTGADLNLCKEIVTLSAGGARPNASRAKGRVTLISGKMTEVDPGVCWNWDSDVPRCLAHAARWVLNHNGDYLELPAGIVGDPTAHAPYQLRPIGDFLDLLILHVPGDELLPAEAMPDDAPPIGTIPDHFIAYYDLFDNYLPALLPRFADPSGQCLPTPACPAFEFGGGSAFSCMLAKVTT